MDKWGKKTKKEERWKRNGVEMNVREKVSRRDRERDEEERTYGGGGEEMEKNESRDDKKRKKERSGSCCYCWGVDVLVVMNEPAKMCVCCVCSCCVQKARAEFTDTIPHGSRLDGLR